MATSGAYSFSPTFLTAINKALRILRITQQGQVSGSYNNALAAAAEAGEFVLVNWATKKIPVWSKYDVNHIITIAGHNPYTVGEGLDIDLNNTTSGSTLAPVDVLKVFYVYAVDGTRIELNCLADLDYKRYSLPASPGIPTSYHYQKLQSISGGSYGKLYFYPVPDGVSIGDSFALQFQRYLYSGGTTSNNLDMPIEFVRAFAWAIAKELLTEYEQPAQRTQFIIGMADQAYEEAGLSDSDGGSVFFQPDMRYHDRNY